MSFRATIKDGKLSFSTKVIDTFRDFLNANEGKHVTIELDKPSRSQSQNAYYWTYLEIVARETGDNADDLHEFFKRKLLPPVFKTIRGEELRLPASTRDLDKAAFSDYLDRIAAMTGVALPDPEAAGYISNYEPLKKAA